MTQLSNRVPGCRRRAGGNRHRFCRHGRRRRQEGAARNSQVRQEDRHAGGQRAREQWWRDLNLESPEALIKVFVSQSKCFTLVDRGKGLEAAQAERALAGGGELRGGSNVGKGQMKAADYVLVPDIVNKNANSGGKNIGGIAGWHARRRGRRPGRRHQPQEQDGRCGADADRRALHRAGVAAAGPCQEDRPGLGCGRRRLLRRLRGRRRQQLRQHRDRPGGDGRLSRCLRQDGQRREGHRAGCEGRQRAAGGHHGQARQAVSTSAEHQGSTVVRDLDAGAMLYPTGEKQGPFWKVQDELGNEGWVPWALLQLAK